MILFWRRWGVWLLGALPLAYVFEQAYNAQLGADPARALVQFLGLWAMRLLLLCLSMTPCRWLTGQGLWIRYRRPLGLLAFAYASLHLLAYLTLLYGNDGSAGWHELQKRPYLWLGLAAWLTLLVLAATSTQKARRRLGRRWLSLHRSVYGALILALAHGAWAQKLPWAGFRGTIILAALLLGWRLGHALWPAQLRKTGSPPA